MILEEKMTFVVKEKNLTEYLRTFFCLRTFLPFLFILRERVNKRTRPLRMQFFFYVLPYNNFI